MRVFVARHCKATGQEADALLTEEGGKQAESLVACFNGLGIQEVISSPFERAIATVRPFLEASSIPFSIDARLQERILGKSNDWMRDLRLSYEDEHRVLPEGETTAEATARVRSLYDGLSRDKSYLLVTHGNLMSLLLRSFDHTRFGFDEWRSLTNPDLYLLNERGGEVSITRVPFA